MVWRKYGTYIHNLFSTVKHGGGGVLLWGSMSGSGVGEIEFIDYEMNKFVYLSMPKRKIKESAMKLGLPREF